ncbi:photosystem II reaction center W protein, chloroplastic-like isoform X2 [Lotus japonicus]|uniref:photosystem II reaction center W protein, chloroplastic-like isoform X2 n=1 Tax=Lotus japonicus TaxID=34305 RepID=UPI0025846364|nr:photosystem II reaction center W protein, chloroplastic-like isoform X2 [Lotus japonicus]
MATISATITTPSITRAGLVQKRPLVISSSPVLALAKVGRVRCSMEGKPSGQESSSKMGMGASLMAAASAAAMSSPAAMALVDERLSTEGTGLPFGLSNNLLGWILFGVFGLIWAVYFVYASGLDEDEESGLSL